MDDTWAERAQKHYESARRWVVAAEDLVQEAADHTGYDAEVYAYKMAELSIGLGILADHLGRPDVLAELIDLRTRLTTVDDMAGALLASIDSLPDMIAPEDHRKDLELLRKLIRGEQP